MRPLLAAAGSRRDATENRSENRGHRYVLGRGLNAWAFRDPNTLRRRARLREKQAVHHGLAKGNVDSEHLFKNGPMNER
jgi:hypothetical protein